MVEVRAQEHGNHANIIEMQGALDELPCQSVRWIGDDRADACRWGSVTQKVCAFSDVATDHVEANLPQSRNHLSAATGRFPDHAADLGQMRDQRQRDPRRRLVLIERLALLAANYDPKLHLRHLLDPIDLYVRHTFGPINAIVRHFLPLLEPTRHDETLAKFSNYHELWATR